MPAVTRPGRDLRPASRARRLGAARSELGRPALGAAGAQARRRVGPAAVELEALGLEPAADLGRVAERGRADRAVGLQDAVGARRLLAHEALVERAGVAVGAAAGVGDVAVAHPPAGRDRGEDLAHGRDP